MLATRRSAVVVWLAATAFSLVAPRVEGATVTARLDKACDDDVSCAVVYALRVRAKPGERNDMRISYRHGVLRVRDLGARLRVAGPGCRLSGRHAARCIAPRDRRAEGMSLEIDVGDEDDRVRMPGRGVRYRRDASALNTKATTLRGGKGNDRITGPGELIGESGADLLVGSANEDRLIGGSGADRIEGGAGDDEISDDATYIGSEAPPISPANDRVDGGPGTDRLYYDSRVVPVSIDLLAGVAGQAGERDAIARVENATGGSGADIFVGDNGPNDFFDGRGAGGEMHGGGGNDTLSAWDARLISGGPGDDWLVPSASGIGVPTPPELDCGPGNDAVETDDNVLASQLVVPRGCEYATTDDFELSLRPRQTAPEAVSIELWTSREAPIPRGISLLLTDEAGATVGAGSARPRARHVEVPIRLDAAMPDVVTIVVTIAPRRAGTKVRAQMEVATPASG